MKNSIINFSTKSILEKEIDESLKKFTEEREKNLTEIKLKKNLKKIERVKQFDTEDKEETEEEGELNLENLKIQDIQQGEEDNLIKPKEGWKTWDPVQPKDKTYKYENIIKLKLGISVIPERLRKLITKLMKGYSRKNLKHNADELSRLLRKRTRTLLPSDPFVGKGKEHVEVKYNMEETFAYVVHRVPGTFGCNERVFLEIKNRFPLFQPSSMLDFGSGPGTAVWAAERVWGGEIKKYLIVEPSSSMTHVSNYLLRDFLPKIQRRRFLYLGREKLYPLVVASYSLTEIPEGDDRNGVINTLWKQVEEGGMLVILESGTPTGFSIIKHVREYLLSNPSFRASVVAPCTHSLKCGMPLNSWCHFAQRVRRTPLQMNTKLSTSLNFEDEKYSYLVLHKLPLSSPTSTSPTSTSPTSTSPTSTSPTSTSPTSTSSSFPISSTSTPIENNFFDNNEKISSVENSQTNHKHRIIRPPLKRSKHVQVPVCTDEGIIRDMVVSKSMGSSLYLSARKSFWGDIFSYPSSTSTSTSSISRIPSFLPRLPDPVPPPPKTSKKNSGNSLSSLSDGKSKETFLFDDDTSHYFQKIKEEKKIKKENQRKETETEKNKIISQFTQQHLSNNNIKSDKNEGIIENLDEDEEYTESDLSDFTDFESEKDIDDEGITDEEKTLK